jgi:hypothetical protein
MSLASCKKASCAFNTFVQLLPSSWSLCGILEGSKSYNSAKTWQGPKILQNLHPISLLSTTGELFEKLISKAI